LLVADAMIGQDAVKTAGEFDRRLSLSGFVLTKLDGDARGGAALSIKEVTGKPIKFIGMGEALDKLEEFRPEGLASRILGFGDIVGLMKDFEGVVDEKKAEEDAEKILTGNFDLHDFVEQIKLVKKMGSVNELLEKFPLFGELPEGVSFDDKELHRVEAIISSMTKTERKNPSVIGDERIVRIARGSGQKKEHVRGLLDRFFAMQKVMRQLGGGPGAPGMNLLQRLPGFRQLAQLNQLKGMPPEDMAKLFGLPKDMAAGAVPATGGEGSHSAELARRRLLVVRDQLRHRVVGFARKATLPFPDRRHRAAQSADLDRMEFLDRGLRLGRALDVRIRIVSLAPVVLVPRHAVAQRLRREAPGEPVHLRRLPAGPLDDRAGEIRRRGDLRVRLVDVDKLHLAEMLREQVFGEQVVIRDQPEPDLLQRMPFAEQPSQRLQVPEPRLH